MNEKINELCKQGVYRRAESRSGRVVVGRTSGINYEFEEYEKEAMK